jgi:phosphatidate cytidylyltransferase
LALNLQTLKTRTLSAIAFVVIMLLGLFVNQYTFIGLFTFIMFGCLYEFSKIIKQINAKKYFVYLPVAFIYIILPTTMMIDLGTNGYFSKLSYSPIFPTAILFSIWINDTMAYLVGSLIGKTPFSKVSPKKTWEGTIGGIIICLFFVGFFFSKSGFYIYSNKVENIHWFIIAAISGVFGTIGDLIESKLKRTAGIKDSGNILPGHGGFLDRFDSFLLATPLVWIYIKIFIP